MRRRRSREGKALCAGRGPLGWPTLGLPVSAAAGPCILGTPRPPADQRCGHAALRPHLLIESWRTEAAVLLGTKRRHSCPNAHRGLLKARSLPHPPGTRKGVPQRGRRGRPSSGEEAWQSPGGRWPYNWDRDSGPMGPMGHPQKRCDENGLRASPELQSSVGAKTRPHSARAAVRESTVRAFARRPTGSVTQVARTQG